MVSVKVILRISFNTSFSIEMQCNKYHTCHCFHWGDIAIVILFLLLTTRPEKRENDMDLGVLRHYCVTQFQEHALFSFFLLGLVFNVVDRDVENGVAKE